jgi:hypothetical protein
LVSVEPRFWKNPKWIVKRRDSLIRIPYRNRDTDMQYLKTFLASFLLPLVVAIIASVVTAPPPPVSVSVPMVIIHIAR